MWNSCATLLKNVVYELHTINATEIQVSIIYLGLLINSSIPTTLNHTAPHGNNCEYTVKQHLSTFLLDNLSTRGEGFEKEKLNPWLKHHVPHALFQYGPIVVP